MGKISNTIHVHELACVYLTLLNTAVNGDVLGEQVSQYRQAVYVSLQEYLRSKFFLSVAKPSTCVREHFSDRSCQIVQ